MSENTAYYIEKIRHLRATISLLKEAERALKKADGDPGDIMAIRTVIKSTQFDVDDIVARHFPVTTFKAPQVGIYRGE